MSESPTSASQSMTSNTCVKGQSSWQGAKHLITVARSINSDQEEHEKVGGGLKTKAKTSEGV